MLFRSNVTTNTTIQGNHSKLVEGNNTITLKGLDEAYNDHEVTFNLTVLTTSPNTNVINVGSEISKVPADNADGYVWKLKVYGNQVDNISAYINGVAVTNRNNNTWDYFSNNFDLVNNDVVLELVDAVNNYSLRYLWFKDQIGRAHV